MATNPPKRQFPAPTSSVILWLLDSDPSIRWQVLRDLTDAPANEVAAERAKVATEGWGARLLSLQEVDGLWGGAPHGITGGTQRCTLSCCYGILVWIRRAIRHAGLWASPAIL